MSGLGIRSFAKLNLGLRVVGRRSDGFHELETRFQAIDLGDEIIAEPAARLELEVDDPSIPADSANLVWRAAELLRGEAGGNPGARIRLRKGVPAGGGLGGGSGDAAATLRLLGKLWQVEVGDERLMQLAARLGSDVPFFLVGGTALGLGRGERIVPEPDLPAEEVLLLVPPFSLPTPAVYRDFAIHEGASLTNPGGAPTIPPPETSHPQGIPTESVNDLEPAAMRLAPALRVLRDGLLRAGADSALVTGSGSCLFGRFASRVVPEGIEARLPGGARAVRCRFLTRDECRRRLEPAG